MVQHARGAFRAEHFETHAGKAACHFDCLLFVGIAHAQEHFARGGQLHAGGHLCFGERNGQAAVRAHDFACGAHFWTEDDVDTGELGEREDAFLDGIEAGVRNLFGAKFFQRCTHHHLGGDVGPGNALGL